MPKKTPVSVKICLLLLSIGVLAAVTYRWAKHEHRATVEERIDQYSDLIWKHAGASALPTELVRTVIRVESGGNPRAVSPKQARGLMQITPVTQKEIERRFGLPKGDLFDPGYNIQAGTTYLRYLIDRFDGDVRLALAAYHAGPTRMAKHRRENPDCTGAELIERFAPASTRAYCRMILGEGSPFLPPEPAAEPSRVVAVE